MLNDNKIKEELSLAYIMAVAAVGRFATEFTRVDYDSVDLTVKYNGWIIPTDETTLYSPKIELQVKASTNLDIRNEHIYFPLPIKNYNDLRARSGNPRLLVILDLPAEKADWLKHTQSELVLKRCAYYLNLDNAPKTENNTSVTVQVPLTNILSPEALHQLMVKAAKEETL